MAGPNWELWEQILRDLQSGVASLRSDMTDVKAQLNAVEAEVKGLKRMSQMALGTASGADFVAERAEQLAQKTSARLDALIEALHSRDIHVDA